MSEIKIMLCRKKESLVLATAFIYCHRYLHDFAYIRMPGIHCVIFIPSLYLVTQEYRSAWLWYSAARTENMPLIGKLSLGLAIKQHNLHHLLYYIVKIGH